MKDRDFDRARAHAFLRQPRPCRVCGTVFRPERFDALTCSSTCRSRRMRGQDLAYVAGLGKAAREEQMRLHQNVAELISELMRSFALLRQRRRQGRAARQVGEAVLMHGRRLIWEHLTQMEREGREVSLIEAINEVLIANYPTEIVSAIEVTLLVGASKAERELVLKAHRADRRK